MNSDDDGVLFLLEGPVIDPHSIEQFKNVCLVSLARHRRLAHRLVTSPPEVSPTWGPSNKRRLSQAFGSKSDVVGREEQRRKLNVASPSTPLASSGISLRSASNLRSSKAGVFPQTAQRNRRFGSLIGRTRVSSEDIDALKPAVWKIEQDSTVPTETLIASGSAGHFCLYTLSLKLVPSAGMSRDLKGFIGTKYKMLVDTGDSSFWFFAFEFQELLCLEGSEPVVTAWDDDPEIQQIIRHPTLPRGPESCVVDRKCMSYFDGGTIYVSRWADEVPFVAQGWNWQKSAPEKSAFLRFPRVLATHASLVSASQPPDGNLGLAVPGFRGPWYTSTDGQELTESNRLTFFDILAYGERGVSAVETPRQLTVRLLVPDRDRQALSAPRTRQSFLYYGIGSPCGIVGPGDDSLLLPEYSPRLQIIPALDYAVNFNSIFDLWRLRLLSLTLLEPRVDHPNYQTLDPAEWKAHKIDIRMETEPTGIPVVLDTGSGSTVLPRNVVRSIWSVWFQQPLEEFPEPALDQDRPDRSDMVYTIWHDRPDRFSKHDLQFEFMDNSGRVSTFRCGAEHFLGSPWRHAGHGTLSLIQPAGEDHPLSDYLLGINFFWCALVKLDAGNYSGNRPMPGSEAPTVQLAAQRIVHDGHVVAGPYEFGLHEHLPPRLQSVARNQPEVCPELYFD